MMNINQDAERIAVEVVQRVMERWGGSAERIEDVLFDTIYQERRRLETDPMGTPAQARYYDGLQARAIKASHQQQRELLREVVERFVYEIQGHFDKRVYRLATKVVPTGLNLMLNTMSPIRLLEGVFDGSGGFINQVTLAGHTDLLQKLANIGTIVLVPTHVSNLDSVLVGFSLYQMGLPPFSYGAGLNLFANRLFGFFMNHLGAYKVDRRKKAALYKDVLKTYAGVTMELGYHNLFFPGGTRSRSGGIERKLKLGLQGMALNAYIHNLMANRPKPDIFIVPCTINYQLVLEAKTLIDDFLKAEGKSRYIIEDDESSKPKLILQFARRLFRLQSKVHLVFGHPMDPFGNLVDEKGRSMDARGRPIDRTRYVFVNGAPGFDAQRDREYTLELADAVVQQYAAYTVVKPVNLVSYAIMQRLKTENPELDIYRLLRTGGRKPSFNLGEIYKDIQLLIEELQVMETQGRLKLDPLMHSNDMVMVLEQALAHLSSDQEHPVLTRRGDRLFHHDRNLLLYYGNRLGLHPAMEAK